MKKAVLVLCVILTGSWSFGQFAPPQSVAVSDDIFAIRNNPAGLAINGGFQFGAVAPLSSMSSDSLELYLGSGMGNSAAGYSVRFAGEYTIWRLANSVEVGPGTYFGYGIDLGQSFAPEYSVGMVFHPLEQLSIGVTAENFTATNDGLSQYRGGLAIRPFGNRLTVGVEGVYSYYPDLETDDWDAEAYLSTEFLDGIYLDGYYTYNTNTIGVGVGVNFGHHGLRATADIASDNLPDDIRGTGAYSYSGPYRRSVFMPERQTKWISMELNGALPEQSRRFSLFGGSRGRALTDIVMQIDEYSRRNDVAGLMIKLGSLEGGLPKYQEIRRALIRFRETGKKVYVYMNDAGNGSYYLASAADKAFLHPAGSLWLTGAASQLIYVKSLLQKLGINAEYVHIGEYKTAGDPLTRDSASTAELEQLNAYFDTFYDEFTGAIATGRDLLQDKVETLIDSGPYSASGAIDAGLIDSLLYEDEMKEYIESSDTSPKLIAEKKFRSEVQWNYDWDSMAEKKIAVVYAVGPIVPGKSSQSPFTGQMTMGSETIARAIKKAREDEQVKAIILRVDSPGGSALASDIIWREVKRSTEGDDAKPVLVSMSDVAASGGYYISMAADTILANQGTVTGSIGVLAGTVDISELLETVGVNTQVIKRGENADFLSPTREMTEKEREKLYNVISEIYDTFISKASDGRGIPVDSVDQLGRGRIYSGSDALSKGLVDELGGLYEAVAIAKDLAGISKMETTMDYYPKFEMGLMDLLQTSIVSSWSKQLSPASQQYLKQLETSKILSREQVLYLATHLPVWKDWE